MKKLLVFIITMFICTPAWPAPTKSVINARSTTKVTALPVGNTDTLYTTSIDMKDASNGEDIGILYKATSDGVVNLNLKAQISFKPSTDGVADADYVDSHVIDTSITNEAWHLATIDTVSLTHLRFKIVGQGSNDTST